MFGRSQFIGGTPCQPRHKQCYQCREVYSCVEGYQHYCKPMKNETLRKELTEAQSDIKELKDQVQRLSDLVFEFMYHPDLPIAKEILKKYTNSADSIEKNELYSDSESEKTTLFEPIMKTKYKKRSAETTEKCHVPELKQNSTPDVLLIGKVNNLTLSKYY